MEKIKYRTGTFYNDNRYGVKLSQVFAAIKRTGEANALFYSLIESRKDQGVKFAERLCIAISGEANPAEWEDYRPLIGALNELADLHEGGAPAGDDAIGEEIIALLNKCTARLGRSEMARFFGTLFADDQIYHEQRNQLFLSLENRPTALVALRWLAKSKQITPPDEEMRELLQASSAHTSRHGAAATRAILKKVASVAIVRDVPADMIADAINALSLEDESEESESEEAFG